MTLTPEQERARAALSEASIRLSAAIVEVKRVRALYEDALVAYERAYSEAVRLGAR